MQDRRYVALVRFFRGLGRRPREQSPADQDRDPGLREEHLLAVTLRCLRAAHRAQSNSPALEYVSEHAPELLHEEESAMMRRARHFIQLWQAGTPMTKPSKLHLHDPASADQVKGANFLDNRRRHYRGSRSQPGCGGVCEVCQLMTAAYSGWHETKIHKRKGAEVGGGPAQRPRPTSDTEQLPLHAPVGPPAPPSPLSKPAPTSTGDRMPASCAQGTTPWPFTGLEARRMDLGGFRSSASPAASRMLFDSQGHYPPQDPATAEDEGAASSMVLNFDLLAGEAVGASSLRPVPHRLLNEADDDGRLWFHRYRGEGKSRFLRSLSVLITIEKAPGHACVARVQLVPGTGVARRVIGDMMFQETIQVTMTWALLHEKAMAQAGFTVATSLRALQHDVLVEAPGIASLNGTSIGVIMALSFLQVITDCHFDDKVTGTGTVTLGGDVLGVGGVPAKVRCAAGLKDCHKVLVPSEDEAISKQEVAGLRLRKKFTVQAISSINDAIQHALRLPAAVRPLAPPHPSTFTRVRVSPAVDFLATLEVAVVPGCGKVTLSGFLPPNPTFAVPYAAASLERAMLWISGLSDAKLSALLQAGGVGGRSAFQGRMIDLPKFRVTPLHPDADEYRQRGQQQQEAGGVAEIPERSISFHVHGFEAKYKRVPECSIYGVTLAVALASLVTGRAPREDVSFFGDVFVDGQIGACGKLGRSTLEYMARQGIRAVYMTSTDLRKLHAAHPELATGKQPPLPGLPSIHTIRWVEEAVRVALAD